MARVLYYAAHSHKGGAPREHAICSVEPNNFNHRGSQHHNADLSITKQHLHSIRTPTGSIQTLQSHTQSCNYMPQVLQLSAKILSIKQKLMSKNVSNEGKLLQITPTEGYTAGNSTEYMPAPIFAHRVCNLHFLYPPAECVGQRYDTFSQRNGVEKKVQYDVESRLEGYREKLLLVSGYILFIHSDISSRHPYEVRHHTKSFPS